MVDSGTHSTKKFTSDAIGQLLNLVVDNSSCIVDGVRALGTVARFPVVQKKDREQSSNNAKISCLERENNRRSEKTKESGGRQI
ncbi:MAG: hypothetical protein LBB13_01155 [Rickettsiales bacterium]|jgi:hypothetical protein|nr:hypothetical protein [Rickettsiales bacterium]